MYGYPNVPSSFSSPAHSTVKKPKSSVTFNDDLPVDDAPPFSLASSRNLKDETHETKSGAHHSGGFVSTLLSLASHRYPSHPKPTSNSVNFNDETFEQTEGRINEPVNEPSTKTIDQSESITAWNPSQGVQSSSMNGVNNNGGIAKLSMVMFEDLTQDDPTHEQELSIGNSTTQSTPGGVLKKTTVNYAQRAVEGTIEGAVKSSSDDVVTADEVNNPIVSTLQTERLPPEGAPTRRHKRHHNSEDRQNAPKSDEIKKKKNKKSTSRNVKLSSANKTIKRSEEKDTKVKDTKVKETSKMAMKMASGVANSLLNVRSTDKKSTTSLTGVDDKKKMPRNPSSPSSTTNSQKTKSNHKSSSSETAAAGVLQPNECEEGGVVSEKTELIRAAETDVDPLVAPPISHAEAYPKMTTIQIAAPSSPRDVYVATSLTPSIKDDLDSAHASRNEPEGKKKKKGIRLGVGKKKKKSVQGSQDTEIEGPAAVRIRELEEELAQMADDILDEQRRIDENWAELEIERENISNAKKAMDKDLLRREEEIEGRRNLLETQLGQVAEQSEMIQTERLQLDKMKNALTQSEVNHGGDDSGGGSGGGRDIADLRNQLHIQMENTKELEQELEDTRSVMLELERDAERYESNWMKEVEESKQLKSELLNLTPNSQRMADSSEGLMHSKEIKEALETRICDLEVQLSDALRYKETVTSELEALKATNESQVEALTMMTARKVESERSLNQQVISLKDALDAMENENLSLVANNKKMQGQISESEGGHHRRAEEGELDAIKAERDSLLTEVEELKLTLKHREDRFDEEDNRKRGSSFPVWTASVSSDGDSFTEGYKKKNDKVVCDRISELEEKLMAANKQLEQYAEAKNSLMDSPTSSASRNHPTGGGLPDLSRVLSISKKEREKTSRADLEQQLEHYKELATCLQSAFLELNNASIRADAIGNGLQCPSDEDIAPPEADVPVIVYKIANSLMENAHNRTSSKGSKTNNADSVPGGMTTAEIDDLLESHENEITTLEQSLDKAKARLGVAELDLKEKQELCEHRALEIDQLKTKLITKSEEIEEKTTLLTSKDLEISHFVTQMKELTEKEAEGQDEVKNLEVEIVNLRRELEGLHSELNNDQKDMASKLSDSLQKNTELEKTIAKHETEINKLETSIDDLEIEIKQNRESFTQLQHERSDSVSAYNTLENEHMHLKQKKREVEDDLEASCQTIKSLESDKKELDTEMKALSKEVKSLEKALDKVQGEMKKKTSKTHDQSDVISKLENELEDAKAELSAKESSNLLLNEMIEKKHDEVDEQQSTVDTLTNQLEALKSKHEQVKIELDTITEENHKLHEESEEMGTMTIRFHEADRLVEQLKAENSELEQTIVNLESEIDEMNDQLAKGTDEVIYLKGMVKKQQRTATIRPSMSTVFRERSDSREGECPNTLLKTALNDEAQDSDQERPPMSTQQVPEYSYHDIVLSRLGRSALLTGLPTVRLTPTDSGPPSGLDSARTSEEFPILDVAPLDKRRLLKLLFGRERARDFDPAISSLSEEMTLILEKSSLSNNMDKHLMTETNIVHQEEAKVLRRLRVLWTLSEELRLAFVHEDAQLMERFRDTETSPDAFMNLMERFARASRVLRNRVNEVESLLTQYADAANETRRLAMEDRKKMKALVNRLKDGTIPIEDREVVHKQPASDGCVTSSEPNRNYSTIPKEGNVTRAELQWRFPMNPAMSKTANNNITTNPVVGAVPEVLKPNHPSSNVKSYTTQKYHALPITGAQIAPQTKWIAKLSPLGPTWLS
eukprot:GHVH01000426.1.p1 GENE.GHVH01000426.1~~GHVH01000426.1.p1  ORF type:complete len:1784 (+),score=394.85 GHVH01000426.1:1247-6598(+)